MKDKRLFQTPKKTNAWQKELLEYIGKQVNLEHHLGRKITEYENCKILNVDIKTGNRFKLMLNDGKKITLIGGSYIIEELNGLNGTVRKDYGFEKC